MMRSRQLNMQVFHTGQVEGGELPGIWRVKAADKILPKWQVCPISVILGAYFTIKRNHDEHPSIQLLPV